MSEPNPEFDKQKCPTHKILSNKKKLDIRQCDKSSEEQIESENVEIPRELNASLPCWSDTVPPPWFSEYMESVSDVYGESITSVHAEVNLLIRR